MFKNGFVESIACLFGSFATARTVSNETGEGLFACILEINFERGSEREQERAQLCPKRTQYPLPPLMVGTRIAQTVYFSCQKTHTLTSRSFLYTDRYTPAGHLPFRRIVFHVL